MKRLSHKVDKIQQTMTAGRYEPLTPTRDHLEIHGR